MACSRCLVVFATQNPFSFLLTAPPWLSSGNHILSLSYSMFFRWGGLRTGRVTVVWLISPAYLPRHCIWSERICSPVKASDVQSTFLWNHLSFSAGCDLEEKRPWDLGRHLSTTWNSRMNLICRKLVLKWDEIRCCWHLIQNPKPRLFGYRSQYILLFS